MRSGCGLANNESTVEVVRNQTRYNTTFSPNEFPWHVYLTVNYISGDDSSNCGGFLIDSKWVLTTAHCFNTGTNKLLAKIYSLITFKYKPISSSASKLSVWFQSGKCDDLFGFTGRGDFE